MVSGTMGCIVGMMDGTPAGGPGGRIGYELMTEKVSLGLTAGGFVAVGSSWDVNLLPDVRLTLSYVRR